MGDLNFNKVRDEMVACIKHVAHQVLEESKGKKSITHKGFWWPNVEVQYVIEQKEGKETMFRNGKKTKLYRTWNGTRQLRMLLKKAIRGEIQSV